MYVCMFILHACLRNICDDYVVNIRIIDFYIQPTPSPNFKIYASQVCNVLITSVVILFMRTFQVKPSWPVS